MNLYEAVGGEATFVALTDAFYDQVAADPLLRPLFPEDMAPGKRRLAHFLIESLGGPPRWSRERHFAHLVNAHHRRAFSEAERDAWINHMLAAIDTVGITGAARVARVDHFECRLGDEPPPVAPGAYYGSGINLRG